MQMQKRPNRSAKARREQYRRAEARCVQAILRNMQALHHRGTQHSKLGHALCLALQAAEEEAVAMEEKASADLALAARLVEPMASSELPPSSQPAAGAEGHTAVETAPLAEEEKAGDEEAGEVEVAAATQEAAIAVEGNEEAVAETAEEMPAKMEVISISSNESVIDISTDEEAEEEDSKSAAEDDSKKDEKDEEGAKNLMQVHVRAVSHRGQKVARLCKTFEGRTA